MSDMQGAYIEIVERRKRPAAESIGASLIVPNEVRVNGQPIAMPDNEPITVHDIGSRDVVKVTLTVFARRIFVGHEDVDDDVLQAVHDAQGRLAEAHARNVQALADYRVAVEQAQHELAEANQKLAEVTA